MAAFRKGKYYRTPDSGTLGQRCFATCTPGPRPLLLSPSYRITIGNKTCVFEKENDPTVLRAPSAGKLTQYTVEDGGHVEAGGSYAEMEVSHSGPVGVSQASPTLSLLPQGRPSRIASANRPGPLAASS